MGVWASGIAVSRTLHHSPSLSAPPTPPHPPTAPPPPAHCPSATLAARVTSLNTNLSIYLSFPLDPPSSGPGATGRTPWHFLTRPCLPLQLLLPQAQPICLPSPCLCPWYQPHSLARFSTPPPSGCLVNYCSSFKIQLQRASFWNHPPHPSEATSTPSSASSSSLSTAAHVCHWQHVLHSLYG